MLKSDDKKAWLPGVPYEEIRYEGTYPFVRLAFPELGR